MRIKGRDMALALAAVLLAGLLLGLAAAPVKIQEVTKEVVREAASNITVPGLWSVDISVPAVDEEGRGVATQLTVETGPGTGRILTNIDKLLFWVDTQESIQTAKAIAENYTGINTGTMDLIYTITTDNATIIGGPSAGAALTLATIAALEHRQLNSSVMITGTINEGGSIGPIGGVLEKAKAARDAGAVLFLVPPGQGTESVLKPVEKCTQRPNFVYCETRYETTTVNIGQAAGIEVKEVASIGDAVSYFLG